jgi:hypothetical protein
VIRAIRSAVAACSAGFFRTLSRAVHRKLPDRMSLPEPTVVAPCWWAVMIDVP